MPVVGGVLLLGLFQAASGVGVCTLAFSEALAEPTAGPKTCCCLNKVQEWRQQNQTMWRIYAFSLEVPLPLLSSQNKVYQKPWWQGIEILCLQGLHNKGVEGVENWDRCYKNYICKWCVRNVIKQSRYFPSFYKSLVVARSSVFWSSSPDKTLDLRLLSSGLEQTLSDSVFSSEKLINIICLTDWF